VIIFLYFACQIRADWKNQYGNRERRLTEGNDGISLATTGGTDK